MCEVIGMSNLENRRRFLLQTGASAMAITVGNRFLPQVLGDETDVTATMAHPRAIPLVYVDDPWINRLKVTMRPPERGMSLLIFDPRFHGEPIDLRSPEGIGSMSSASRTYRYVVGQAWQVSQQGDWSYKVRGLQHYAGSKTPVFFNGELNCRTEMNPDGLTAHFSLYNGDFSTQKSVFLWVCALYRWAPRFEKKTLVSVDGHMLDYEKVCGPTKGPSGMRTLTKKGLDEITRLEKEGHRVHCPFRRDFTAEGVRAIRTKADGKEIWSVLRSDDAVLLGGNETNPCTDMALGLGDLEPGERRTAKVSLQLVEGPAEKILQSF